MKLARHLVAASILMALLASPTAHGQGMDDFKSQIVAWNQPFKPFRVIGNIYYVGTSNLACFLITTPAGHILIDTALEQSKTILRSNIETLGFKLTDIKVMLSGHAHFDHVAGHADMKAATGAQVCATAADAVVMESGGRKGFHPIGSYRPVKIDRILKDGEAVRLGDVVLTAHLTAGHTEGNTTWTTTIEESGRKLNVVFAGSMSINPGVRMVGNPTWPGIAEAYAKSFELLKSLPCDVFLGPHAPFFNMEEKVARHNAKAQSNPFIDPQGYRDYIASWEKRYLEQIREERAAK
ncbi:MAG: subclass B3 metallo-beta-lactamase [Acidobacteriota bacterium]